MADLSPPAAGDLNIPEEFYAEYLADEVALVQALLGADPDKVGFFERLQTVSANRVGQAIQTNSVSAIVSSPAWQAAYAKLHAETLVIQQALAGAAIDSAVAEIPGNAQALAIYRKIGAMAETYGEIRAADLVQAIDETTRAGLRQLIQQASRQYMDDQSLSTLRALQEQIQGQIGLTAKQAERIGAWEKAADLSGMDGDLVAQGVEERSAAAIELRAGQIAERGVIESVSWARQETWKAARAAGDIPKNAMKAWADQGDKKVRASHRAQSRVGPIPLDAIYSIQNVMHPPSLDYGCRCSERLIIPALAPPA